MTKGGPRTGSGRKASPDSERGKARARKAEREAATVAAVAAVVEAATGRGHAPDGRKAPDAPANWPFGTQEGQEATLGPDVPTDASPLDVLEQFMRDGCVDIKLRAQCATWAAPYRHAKKADAKNGREKVERPASKFGAMAPPKLVSNRG